MIHPSSKLQDYPPPLGAQTTAADESKLVNALLVQGFLDAKELELARHYQSRMALKGRILPLTQTLVELGLVEKSTLDQLSLEERLKAESETNSSTSQIDELIRIRTEKLQRNYDLLHLATEITRRVILSPTIYELYQRTCSLILDAFGYRCVAFFTPNSDGQGLSLSQFSLANGAEGITRELTIASNTNNGVASAYRNNKVLVIEHRQSPDLPKPVYILSDTQIELDIPVVNDDDFLAVLNVQSNKVDDFDDEAIKRLQTIITNIAPVIKYQQSIDGSKEILGKLSTLYQASQGFSQARTSEDVYRQVLKYLKPHAINSLMLSAQGNHWQPVTSNNHLSDQDRLILALEFNQVTPEDLENNLLFQEYLLINKDSSPEGISQAIYSVYEGLEDASFAIIPMRMDHQLASLIFIYSENRRALDENSLQYCVSLVDLATTSLQRVKSLEGMERQLNRLEVLDSVSQAITFETDINNLYRVIHQQISRVMGDVNLIIATYEPATNLIEIPYAFEENQILSIPPFEMGDGLTSILIKSRKPLLLVEDTEKKAAELGAKIVGAPAKSWLGVPLLLGGEPIGAIIVQDLENEHRFDDEDQKLLTTLSSQVAVTLRNARLLYDASTKAKFEQDAIEITNMLWSATDVESIMQTALEQLGKKLHASTGFIQLELSNSEQLSTPAEVLLP